MKVLIGCECSGAVRRAFRALGHNAWSCDLLPADDGGQHMQGDVLDVLELGWDLAIFHPPCTYLSVSGIHWNNRIPGRAALTDEALAFVRTLLDAPIPRVALENPVGVISTHVRKADQYIQPWQFGDPYAKKTGLWLRGLPPLRPTNVLAPERQQSNGAPRWRNQTASGQNVLGPSEDRAKLRSETYPGIAAAMAAQWGGEA